MGIIYTADRDNQLKELTAERAVAAVPICGRYRLIDFPLSAMVDSGIRNVGVITQKNYNSLMDHLGSGREWDLHGKRAGLVFLPPFTNNDNVGVYTGFLDALHANMHYLRRSKERYVAKRICALMGMGSLLTSVLPSGRTVRMAVDLPPGAAQRSRADN